MPVQLYLLDYGYTIKLILVLVPWDMLASCLGSLETIEQYMHLLLTITVHFQNNKAMLPKRRAQQQPVIGLLQ